MADLVYVPLRMRCRLDWKSQSQCSTFKFNSKYLYTYFLLSFIRIKRMSECPSLFYLHLYFWKIVNCKTSLTKWHRTNLTTKSFNSTFCPLFLCERDLLKQAMLKAYFHHVRQSHHPEMWTGQRWRSFDRVVKCSQILTEVQKNHLFPDTYPKRTYWR